MIDDRLYGRGPDLLLEVIRGIEGNVKGAMLVGHNPELSELAHRICAHIAHLPTCAVAEFAFDAKSWRHIGEARLAKAELDYPKRPLGGSSKRG